MQVVLFATILVIAIKYSGQDGLVKIKPSQKNRSIHSSPEMNVLLIIKFQHSTLLDSNGYWILILKGILFFY
jgi:hypothetical protein